MGIEVVVCISSPTEQPYQCWDTQVLCYLHAGWVADLAVSYSCNHELEVTAQQF